MTTPDSPASSEPTSPQPIPRRVRGTRFRVDAALLLTLGVLQMVGDLAGLAPLKAIAAATAASPAPKVFSAVRGYETYSTAFSLDWRDGSGGAQREPITRERYAKIEGPYNRRNAYGAIVAYGPVLYQGKHSRPLFESVARHGICGEAPLLREMGLLGNIARDMASRRQLTLRYVPREGVVIRGLPLRLDVSCP